MDSNRKKELKNLINKIEKYRTLLKKIVLSREKIDLKLEEIQAAVKQRLDALPQNRKIIITPLRNIIPLANYQYLKLDEPKEVKQNIKVKERRWCDIVEELE